MTTQSKEQATETEIEVINKLCNKERILPSWVDRKGNVIKKHKVSVFEIRAMLISWRKNLYKRAKDAIPFDQAKCLRHLRAKLIDLNQ